MLSLVLFLEGERHLVHNGSVCSRFKVVFSQEYRIFESIYFEDINFLLGEILYNVIFQLFVILCYVFYAILLEILSNSHNESLFDDDRQVVNGCGV
jgi:hypothetical protein